MILYIYLGISVLTVILTVLTTHDVTNKFKAKYPNLRLRKTAVSSRLIIWMRNLICCFMPFVNIGLLWIMVFDYSDLEERLIEETRRKCISNEVTE